MSAILLQRRSSLKEPLQGQSRSWLSRCRNAAGLALASGNCFLPIIATALWALTHPYEGIIGDANLYIGRALADLDPAGLGRDLLFAHDGQSQFSFYPWLVKALVTSCGTNAASLILVVSAAILWLVALALLARCFVNGQRIWIIVAIVALLPTQYGSPQHFLFSEMMATPRPTAEALVLLALGACACGRTVLACAALIAATLVHPLMSLAGWTAICLVLCREDRRWMIAVAALTSFAIIAAILGVPLFDRLVVAMDPQVKALVEDRSPWLFPTLWPLTFVGTIAAQMATIAIAARLFEGRRRHVLYAAMAVGLLGIAVQALLADMSSSLLVVQIQCWRMAWLTAAMGGVALALCTFELWARGGVNRIILAPLVLAWLLSDSPLAAVVLAMAALGLQNSRDRYSWLASRRTVGAIWIAVALCAILLNLGYLLSFAHYVSTAPAAAPHSFGRFWNKRYIAFPASFIILAFFLPTRASYTLWACRCALVVFLTVVLVHFWDDRPPFQRLIDAGLHPPELEQAIASRPGEVLWVEGLGEAWFLTGRPQWASPQQGVASVFSRELALEWRDRMNFLREIGLAERKLPASQRALPSSADLPHLSQAAVDRLCARTDAPAWIIAPVAKDGPPPSAGRPAQIWHLKQPIYMMTDEGEDYVWHETEDFVILPCAGPR
jgi:hypothetical protein